jgi:hypothetical protein
VSWSREKHASITTTRHTVSTSLPHENALRHRKITPASILLILAFPNTRTSSQKVRADQQGSTRSGRLNPIRRGGIFPIGYTPHRNKHFPEGGRPKADRYGRRPLHGQAGQSSRGHSTNDVQIPDDSSGANTAEHAGPQIGHADLPDLAAHDPDRLRRCG